MPINTRIDGLNVLPRGGLFQPSCSPDYVLFFDEYNPDRDAFGAYLIRPFGYIGEIMRHEYDTFGVLVVTVAIHRRELRERSQSTTRRPPT